jgi:hypothetical protein
VDRAGVCCAWFHVALAALPVRLDARACAHRPPSTSSVFTVRLRVRVAVDFVAASAALASRASAFMAIARLRPLPAFVDFDACRADRRRPQRRPPAAFHLLRRLRRPAARSPPTFGLHVHRAFAIRSPNQGRASW